MYYPIIKNKLNELKGINAVNLTQQFIPIFELIDNKFDNLEKIFDSFTSKVDTLLKNRSVYIDIPTYLNNNLYKSFNLNNSQSKFDFFKSLETYFKNKNYKNFIPIISFNYSHDTDTTNYKENLRFVRYITEYFDQFAFRIFSDSSYESNDEYLINSIYSLMGRKLLRASLIIDYEHSEFNKLIPLLKDISKECKIKTLIIAGEAFNNSIKNKHNAYGCGRIKNIHLSHFNNLKVTIMKYKLAIDTIHYSDFSLLDKIQHKLEIKQDKGFLYYPFIKFTTEDGNMCMFTANEKGNYVQYEDLCSVVITNIKTFDPKHCSTCRFIHDIHNQVPSLKFKAGSVWKYRMIAHHITALSKL